MKLGILASHPIQYQAPWFRGLAQLVELKVVFASRPSPKEQSSGFGGEFEWDVDLLSGYQHMFLRNRARHPSSSAFFGCDAPEIRDVIIQNKWDAFIVLGWNLKAYWQAIRACREAGVPILVRGDSQLDTSISKFRKIVKRVAYPYLLQSFDGFLAVGRRNHEYLRHFGVPKDRIFFVPHCVDNDWFAQRANWAQPEREELRAAWNVDDRTTVALFVGKLVPKKRPMDLLAAAGLFDRINRRVLSVFVGAGELECILRAQAAAMDVPVVFCGFKNQTELPAFYRASDVLVLPSDSGETWGLVVNESMACGRPAIVSDAVGCAPDLIDEGETGFTFPVGNVGALADRLSDVDRLSLDDFEFEEFLDRKLKRYSVEAAAQGTVAALHSVLNSTGSHPH